MFKLHFMSQGEYGELNGETKNNHVYAVESAEWICIDVQTTYKKASTAFSHLMGTLVNHPVLHAVYHDWKLELDDTGVDYSHHMEGDYHIDCELNHIGVYAYINVNKARYIEIWENNLNTRHNEFKKSEGYYNQAVETGADADAKRAIMAEKATIFEGFKEALETTVLKGYAHFVLNEETGKWEIKTFKKGIEEMVAAAPAAPAPEKQQEEPETIPDTLTYTAVFFGLMERLEERFEYDIKENQRYVTAGDLNDLEKDLLLRYAGSRGDNDVEILADTGEIRFSRSDTYHMVLFAQWLDKGGLTPAASVRKLREATKACLANFAIDELADAIRRGEHKGNEERVRHVLEGLEGEKRNQLSKACERNEALTSTFTLEHGAATLYDEGLYIELKGTRCGFAVWWRKTESGWEQERKCPNRKRLHPVGNVWCHFWSCDFDAFRG